MRENDKCLIDIRVDGVPPSVNNAYGHGGRRAWMSLAAKEWQTAAIRAIMREQQKEGKSEAYRGPVIFHGEYILSNRRKRDLDNMLKLSLDALVKGGVIADDSQITELWARKEVNCATKGTKGLSRFSVFVIGEEE